MRRLARRGSSATAVSISSLPSATRPCRISGEAEAEARQRRLAVDRDRPLEGGLGGVELVGGERREALDRPRQRRLGDLQRPGDRRLGRAPVADRQFELRQARPRIGVVGRRLDRRLGGGARRVEPALALQRVAPRDMRGPEPRIERDRLVGERLRLSRHRSATRPRPP